MTYLSESHVGVLALFQAAVRKYDVPPMPPAA